MQRFTWNVRTEYLCMFKLEYILSNIVLKIR